MKVSGATIVITGGTGSFGNRLAALGAYGAAGRANVWLNQHPDLAFVYIIGDSPLRVNRCLPAVATPIVPAARSLESPSGACLIRRRVADCSWS